MLPVIAFKNVGNIANGIAITDDGEFYSATALANLKVKGLPNSRAGIYKKAERENWGFINIPGKGARDGVAYFSVPKNVLDGIDKNNNDDDFYLLSNTDYEVVPIKPLVSSRGIHSGGVTNDHPQNKPMLSNMEMAGVNKAGDEKNARVVESLLSSCLAACIKLYGADFETMPAITQMGYAADLYNLLERMASAFGDNVEVMQRLEVDGLAQQLQLLNQLHKVRKFPPPLNKNFFAF